MTRGDSPFRSSKRGWYCKFGSCIRIAVGTCLLPGARVRALGTSDAKQKKLGDIPKIKPHASSVRSVIPRPGRGPSRVRTSCESNGFCSRRMRLVSESKYLGQMNKTADRSKASKRRYVKLAKKEVSPCCRGQIF